MPRKLLHGILIGLGAGAVALALMFTGALDRIENVTWDGRVRMMAKPGPATGKIRLILIDQTSLDWGRDAKKWDWPWPREVFGAVLSFCKRGGAKAFIDDALFTEASRYGVDDDQAFGEAVAKDGPYVTALWLSKSQGLATKWPADLHPRDLSVRGLDGYLKGPAGGILTMPRASFPIPEIASNAALLGSVYFTPDGDGIERRSQVFNVFDGRFVPSLALAGFCAAEAKAELSIEGDVFRARGTGGLVATSGTSAIPLDRSGRTILRFRGPTQTHKAVNVAAVIESELLIREKKKPLIDPEDFRDCYVFFHDMFNLAGAVSRLGKDGAGPPAERKDKQ